MALQDDYVGAKILALARARGIGQDMPVGNWKVTGEPRYVMRDTGYTTDLLSRIS